MELCLRFVVRFFLKQGLVLAYYLAYLISCIDSGWYKINKFKLNLNFTDANAPVTPGNLPTTLMRIPLRS